MWSSGTCLVWEEGCGAVNWCGELEPTELEEGSEISLVALSEISCCLPGNTSVPLLFVCGVENSFAAGLIQLAGMKLLVVFLSPLDLGFEGGGETQRLRLKHHQSCWINTQSKV